MFVKPHKLSAIIKCNLDHVKNHFGVDLPRNQIRNLQCVLCI